MASYEEYNDSSLQDLESNGRHHKESSRDSHRDKDGKERDRKEHKHMDKESDSGKSRSDKDRHRSKDRDRERNKERDKDRDRERGKDKDRDKEKRDKDRDKERDKDRKSHDRSRERERRHHDYDSDRDRERRHRSRHRTHSRSRSRSRGKSRDPLRPLSSSPSPSRSRSRERRRTSGFDMAPPGVSAAPGATVPGQVPGVPQAVPGMMPGFPFGGTQMAALSAMPMQAMTQQAMKHARRVYVGGLPPLANEQTIAAFFSNVMQIIGGNSAPGDAVVNVYINHEKKFAFVEMRTVEEASNAMALDGILFEGMPVRVRRPSDYNPSLAATLGPSQPNPNLNLGAVGLTPGTLGGADGPDKIFVGGLPYYLTETQIKELLESFGPLRGFDLVKDRETGNSKGYAFCVYQDPAVTDVACAALNGLKMGDKTLTVRRATAGAQPKADQENVLLQAQQQIAMQKLALQASAGAYGLLPGLPIANGLAAESPTKVLCLTNLVSVDELRDDQEFEDIYQDVEDECSKYGRVVNLVIPRPSTTDETVAGLGKAFVEYEDTQGSGKARNALNGRKFAGNTVIAVYYPEDKFAMREFDS